MLDLYTWTTPNGRKASIMLEELGLPYRVAPDQSSGRRPVQARVPRDQPEQPDPGDRRSGGSRRQAFAMIESGAILIYLAEKAGKLLPAIRPAATT